MDLETLCNGLLAQGFHAHLHHVGQKSWACELCCGVDVLKPEIPRPRGSGETQLEAVIAAQAELAGMRK